MRLLEQIISLCRVAWVRLHLPACQRQMLPLFIINNLAEKTLSVSHYLLPEDLPCFWSSCIHVIMKVQRAGFYKFGVLNRCHHIRLMSITDCRLLRERTGQRVQAGSRNSTFQVMKHVPHVEQRRKSAVRCRSKNKHMAFCLCCRNSADTINKAKWPCDKMKIMMESLNHQNKLAQCLNGEKKIKGLTFYFFYCHFTRPAQMNMRAFAGVRNMIKN